jgi:CRP-like cAMP-binding protein
LKSPNIAKMDYRLLIDSPLFKELSIEEISNLLELMPYRIRKYKCGSLIAQNGDEVRSVLIVLKGVAKGEMVDYSGRVIKIEDVPAPGALASGFLFGQKNRFPVNVVAVVDCEILIIDKPEFLQLLKKDVRILVNFLNMVSNRSQFLSEKIKFLNFKTLKGKLAQFILQRAGREMSAIMLDLTQNELADFFGVARPSVGRALGEMEAEGIIEAKGKHIRILDRRRLATLTSS